LNDELTELFSGLEDYYENASHFRYSRRIYGTNIIDFESSDYGYENLLRDVSFLFPNLYQLNLNTSSILLESFDKNIKKLGNVKFIELNDYGNDKLIELPSSFFSIERLTVFSNEDVVFKLSDNNGKEIKLKEIYIKGAKIENVPKGIKIIKM